MVRKAADGGHVQAQIFLGVCYSIGKGVKTDWLEARRWLLRAAKTGDAEAQFRLGRFYHDGSEGTDEAVPPDYPESLKWFQKAAEQGHASAQWMLGLCYILGNGVPIDKRQAYHWFRSAANQGHAIAQQHVAICFRDGDGVEIDLARAHAWYELSADHGNEHARIEAELISVRMSRAELERANQLYQQLKILLQRIPEKGHSNRL